MSKSELIDCLYTKDRRKKSKKWLDGFIRILNIKKTEKSSKGNLSVYSFEKKSVGFGKNVKLGENMTAGPFDVLFPDWELYKKTEGLTETIIDEDALENNETKYQEYNNRKILNSKRERTQLEQKYRSKHIQRRNLRSSKYQSTEQSSSQKQNEESVKSENQNHSVKDENKEEAIDVSEKIIPVISKIQTNNNTKSEHLTNLKNEKSVFPTTTTKIRTERTDDEIFQLLERDNQKKSNKFSEL